MSLGSHYSIDHPQTTIIINQRSFTRTSDYGAKTQTAMPLLDKGGRLLSLSESKSLTKSPLLMSDPILMDVI